MTAFTTAMFAAFSYGQAVRGSTSTGARRCLTRAAGRLHGDLDALAASVEAWERIDARFEHACTLRLHGDRAGEDTG